MCGPSLSKESTVNLPPVQQEMFLLLPFILDWAVLHILFRVYSSFRHVDWDEYAASHPSEEEICVDCTFPLRILIPVLCWDTVPVADGRVRFIFRPSYGVGKREATVSGLWPTKHAETGSYSGLDHIKDTASQKCMLFGCIWDSWTS